LRRFLVHLLPEGFVRIRNFGFLANGKRATLCHFVFNRSALHHMPSKKSPPPVPAMFGLASNAVVQWWSSKGLRQLKSNSVLPHLRMPLPHEITIYITKLFHNHPYTRKPSALTEK